MCYIVDMLLIPSIHTIVLLSLGYRVPAPVSKERLPSARGVSLFHRLCLQVSPFVFRGELFPLYRGFLFGELRKACYLARGDVDVLDRAVGVCMRIHAMNDGLLTSMDAMIEGGAVLDERSLEHFRGRVGRASEEGSEPLF